MLGIVTNRQLLQRLNDLNSKVDTIMSEQDEINTAAQQIESDVAAQNSALGRIQAEITALQQQNPALDLTGLNQAVADLGSATAAEQAAAPPAGG